jgi:hypothetical protein
MGTPAYFPPARNILALTEHNPQSQGAGVAKGHKSNAFRP